MKINKLSIIVPVYNEEKTIAKILVQLRNLRLGRVKKEIIIVDDGSTDETKKILTNTPSYLKVISHKKNKGKGAAIKTALKYISGDYVIIQDADLEYDPQDIKKLLIHAKDNRALVVYGSRFLERRRTAPWNLFKGGALLAILTNILYGTRITDEATSYKLFNANLLKSLNLRSHGFEFCPEVTSKIAKKKVKIYEVPISYRPRDRKAGKKLKLFPDAPKAIWMLLVQKIKKERNDFNFFDKWLRERRCRQIYSLLPKGNHLSWCDLGCGSEGYLLQKFAKIIKNGVGIDPLVNYPFLGDISFIKKKIIKKIPLPSGRFDIVTMLALLEHLDHPESVLREAWRILKKNGFLILTTPSPEAKKILEFLARIKIINSREIEEHKHYFSTEELQKLLEKIGFETDVIVVKKFFLGLNIIVSARKT